MSIKRLAVLTGCFVSFVLASAGVVGATGSPRAIGLVTRHVLLTWTAPGGTGTIGEAKATIGSSAILTARLYNRTAQFGKASGTPVGRILLDCSVLTVPPDGNCTGIVHLPDGFFLIGGNGPFVPSPRLYAITGGVGPYVAARGEVKIVTSANGTSIIDVTVLA